MPSAPAPGTLGHSNWLYRLYQGGKLTREQWLAMVDQHRQALERKSRGRSAEIDIPALVAQGILQKRS